LPTYVLLLTLTDQGMRTVKDAWTRAEHNRIMGEMMGVRTIGTWWTQGAYDAITIIDFPDDETATAAAMALGMAGNLRTEMMRAFTSDEMQRILETLPNADSAQ
jgi:uncharacterized protein with GYD domain